MVRRKEHVQLLLVVCGEGVEPANRLDADECDKKPADNQGGALKKVGLGD